MIRTRCLALVVSLLLASSVYVSAQTLDVTDVTGGPGEHASVNITLASAPANAAGVNGTVTYDGTLLTPVEVRPGPLAVGHILEYNDLGTGTASDQLRFVVYSNPTAAFPATDGVLAVVVFAIDPAATPAQFSNLTPIKVIPGDPMLNGTALGDSTGQGVALTVTPGVLTVAASSYPTGDDFTANPVPDWQYAGVLGGPPLGSWLNSALNIASNGDTNEFGKWDSNDVVQMFPATPNAIYHAVAQIKTDQAAKVDVPDIRVRVQTTVDAVTTLLLMKQGTSETDNMLPTTTYSDYDLLFTSNNNTASGDIFGVHFDLINFGFGDANAILSFGQVTVNSALISEIRGAGDANLTLANTFDFDVDVEAWTPFAFTFGTDTNPTLARDGAKQALGIAWTGANDSYGSWKSPTLSAIAASSFYVVDYTISTDVPAQANVPWVRMRVFDETRASFNYELSVQSDVGAAISPTATPGVYSAFVMPHATTVGNPLQVACDIINFGNTDAATGNLWLHNVDLYSGSTGSFPAGF